MIFRYQYSCLALLLSGCVSFVLGSGEGSEDPFHASDFPDGFLFGCATASYQIEGAWNEGGKGENIWDRAIHTVPNYVDSNSTADVACDSYHRYKEDISLLKNTGFNTYRISLSWSRILPLGTDEFVNEEGLQYYKNVLNELAKNGIEPLVTLYHWDLPQPLQDIGGWMNETIVDHFQNYARVVFKTLGNQGDYIATHNVLKAHARVYRMYDREFRPTQKGKVSFSLDGPFVKPKTDSEEDVKAAEQAMQFKFGWFAHAVYSKTGDYPPVMRDVIDRNSHQEGRTKSRLPYFTKEEIEEIKGTYDFLGYNHYSSALATFGPSGNSPSVEKDTNVTFSVDPNWPSSSCDWLTVYPEGLRGVVNWIRKEYGDKIPIMLTEGGYCDDGRIEDYERIAYYDGYLKQLLKAIKEDGANVLGYMAWSIIDNFEWKSGYSKRFGIHHIDFSDPQLPRRKKKSAEYWQKFLLPKA
ncbi:myrosinase 1 [Halyomorpha halys]|uniref:myrosinase 1 n=1 Tax=Halyomorpha halys TaxID=286706 RepID=UPI0034D2B62E